MTIHKVTLTTATGGVFFGYFEHDPDPSQLMTEFHKQIDELPDHDRNIVDDEELRINLNNAIAEGNYNTTLVRVVEN
jgi:hypothetical protein